MGVSTGLTRKHGTMVGLFFAVASMFCGMAIVNAWTPSEASEMQDEDAESSYSRPVAKQKNGYVSSDKCRECHPQHYDSWHASHHRTMTQVPTRDSVIADFDDHVIQHSGRDFRFFHKNDDFFMEMKKTGRPELSKTFKIALSTGAHHQQAFWCETEEGRSLGKIPFIWINAEQRWVPYGSIFLMPSSRLNMPIGVWNRNCIKCHVVNGRPRKASGKGYDSFVAEFGISCEACHGPGEAHIAEHSTHRVSSKDKLSLINPADLSHRKSSQVCGQCHAVFDFYDEQSEQKFNQEGFAFRPGDDLLDTRHVFRMGQDKNLPVVQQKLKENPKFYERQFWSDGMVRVSGREYNGLLETPCYQRGEMSCLSCHDMHPNQIKNHSVEQWADDQLSSAMHGNQACIQCHKEFQSDEKLTRHTHHPLNSAGSRCYNCHMPHTTLGLMKAMRSHTIDSPNVKTTLSTGRPNACNLCHLDKTLSWTAKNLKEWYEIPQPKLSQDEREFASSIRWILKGDAGQRAIVGWHFGWKPAQETAGTDWMAPFLAELLSDSYDVVRFIGYHSLLDVSGYKDFKYDFVGSKGSQLEASRKVREIWRQQKSRRSLARPLFIDANGNLVTDEFKRIRNQRLDPPVILIE